MNILISVLFGLGGYFIVMFFRWSINKKWGGGKLVMTIVAVVAFVLTFSYLGLKGAGSYIESQKVIHLNALRDDAVWRNDALSRAWEHLNVNEKQKDIVPPEEGGTEIKLHSVEDAQIYAQQVAQALEENLRATPNTPPTVEFETKEDMAIQVIEGNSEIQMMDYPHLLSQDNSITSQILEMRVDEVFSASNNGVEARSGELEKSIYILMSLVLVTSVLIVSVRAWGDLFKTN